MDSKRVSRDIKARIYPSLKEAGFAKFTSKRAWRVRDHSTEVVYFQSFSSYLAQGLGCTTFSFAVRFAVHYPSSSLVSLPVTQSPAFPNESQSHASLSLLKALDQKELARRDIWFVRVDGSNLPDVIEDARQAILTQGLAWLQCFSDPEKAYEAFKNRPSVEHENLGGNVGSIGRDHILRALKLVLDPLRYGAERGYDRPTPG